MNIHLKSIALIFSLTLMTGCVAYTPPYYGGPASPYGAPYGGSPYGGYGYGVAPVVPVPYFGFGWGHGGYGGYRHYGGFRHH